MKKILLRVLLVIFAIPVSYLVGGYAIASMKAAACEDLAFHEAAQKNIHGINLSGNVVTVERSAVESSVSPFSVEVTYSVSNDLHATIFIKRFRISVLGNIAPEKLLVIPLV